jgi:hypothetical protein
MAHSSEGAFEMKSDLKNAKIDETFQRVDEIKQIMHENIQKAIQRDVKLSDLEQSAENLENQASEFQTTTNIVRENALFKKRKWTVVLIAIVLTILAIVAAAIVGLTVGLTKKKD